MCPCTTPITSSPTSTTWSAPGTVFALFAGIYYWFPAITGRSLDETLGKIHFWGSFVCMNLIFMPMFAIGLMGVNRRLWDAGASYAHAQPTLQWQAHMTYAAFALAALPAAVHLEPRADGPSAVRDLGTNRYFGRVIGSGVAVGASAPTDSLGLGMWLFIASEAMLFGSLFSGYVMLRVGSTAWPGPVGRVPVARDGFTRRRERGIRSETQSAWSSAMLSR